MGMLGGRKTGGRERRGIQEGIVRRRRRETGGREEGVIEAGRREADFSQMASTTLPPL